MATTPGAIRAALIALSGLSPKRGEADPAFLERVALQISDENVTTAEQWASLSEPAQDWNNLANDAIEKKQPLPPFPDEKEEPAAAPAPSRRRGAAKAEEAPIAYEPKEGDKVTVTTKRGAETTGFIVGLPGDGTLFINAASDGPETDDKEFTLDNLKSIVLAGAVTPAKVEAAPPPPAEDHGIPEPGDTVQVTTARDKVITGNVVEINLDGDLIVVKDPTGAEHELSINRLKNCVVKVRAKPAAGATAPPPPPAPAPAPATGRRGRAPAPAPAAGGEEEDTERVGVGSVIRETLVENPNATQEDCAKALKAAKVDYRDPTLRVSYQSTKKIVAAMLKKHGIK